MNFTSEEYTIRNKLLYYNIQLIDDVTKGSIPTEKGKPLAKKLYSILMNEQFLAQLFLQNNDVHSKRGGQQTGQLTRDQ